MGKREEIMKEFENKESTLGVGQKLRCDDILSKCHFK